MKKIIWIMFAMLAVSVCALEAIYANPLRLHILANSDAPADQQVKLMVRDAILESTAESFGAVLTEEDAEKYVTERMEEVIEIANSVLKERGFDYKASAELGSFGFPLRRYGNRTYPAGEYRALRITLGAGKGHNWWCVLYPPLCITDVYGEDSEIRSYFVDWLKGVFA